MLLDEVLRVDLTFIVTNVAKNDPVVGVEKLVVFVVGCHKRISPGPDGIRYFQVWPSSKVRKVLFVRVGQEAPLFDERTLQLIGAPGR